MTLTVDTDNADEAIRAIRRAKKQSKKDAERLANLRGLAMIRARCAAFNVVDQAEHGIPSYSVYRQDGNDWDRRGYARMISTDIDNVTVAFFTRHGNGKASLYRPSRITHIMEDGAGWIVAVRYETNGQIQWFSVGAADEITHIQHLNSTMAAIVEDFMGKIIVRNDERRARSQAIAG
jgi:hypothetical protein